MTDSIYEKYLSALLQGDRQATQTVIEQVLQSGVPANSLYANTIWPMMLELENLYKNSKITPVQEHIASRINRTIVDQLQNKLPKKPVNGKKITICCCPTESKELGAQIITDLFESAGWQVRFLGGGLTNDDVLGFINEYAPDVLLIYGTEPSQAPQIRKLIDTIKDVNAWPDMKIMLSGGLFNRADGLWQEIGADLFAPTAELAVQLAGGQIQLTEPIERTINVRKRKYKQAASQAV